MTRELLDKAVLPAAPAEVDLAVSGGADSVGLALLAHEAGLTATLHHVDHGLRDSSARDAEFVVALGERLGVTVVVHRVEVTRGPNLESRARAARRRVLPSGALTAHTMDDLAESVLINMMRGAGLEGLSPMLDDPSKPLIGIRRHELRAFVDDSGVGHCEDETNQDPSFLRNRVRLETLPAMSAAAERDLVPILYRQARLLRDEHLALDGLFAGDESLALEEADCRELATWSLVRLRRWLRQQLRQADDGDGWHPPSADEIERAVLVVRGEVVATELAGGRRLSRSAQRLTLST